MRALDGPRCQRILEENCHRRLRPRTRIGPHRGIMAPTKGDRLIRLDSPRARSIKRKSFQSGSEHVLLDLTRLKFDA